MNIIDNMKKHLDKLQKKVNKNSDSQSKPSVDYASISLENSQTGEASPAPSKLVFAVAIASLIFSVIPMLSLSGFVLAIATLVICFYLARAQIIVYKEKLTKVIAVVALALGLIVSFSSFGMLSAQNNKEAIQVEEAVQKVQVEYIDKPCMILKVGATNSTPVSTLSIVVKGTSRDGILIDDIRTIRLGIDRELDYPAGTYEFSYTEFLSSNGEEIYRANSVSCKYDATEKIEVSLPLVLDTAKTQEIKDAKEAEKAAAEVEAAAQKEAEAQALAAAGGTSKTESTAKSNGSGGSDSPTVYVASSGNGSKYHSRSSCSGMKGAISMSRAEAEKRGYTPCKKCY